MHADLHTRRSIGQPDGESAERVRLDEEGRVGKVNIWPPRRNPGIDDKGGKSKGGGKGKGKDGKGKGKDGKGKKGDKQKLLPPGTKIKTAVCGHWDAVGTCHRGDGCAFLHEDPAQKKARIATAKQKAKAKAEPKAKPKAKKDGEL